MKSGKAESILQALLAVSVIALGVVVWDTVRDKVITVGDTAPEFQITADNGMTMSLASLSGKVVVLNFWASWCAPCRQETPGLQAFYNQVKDSGVVVVGISIDKSDKNYKAFLKRYGVSYLTARDPEAKISDSYGTYRYPETYVIDRHGKVVQKSTEALNFMDDSLVRYVKSL